MALLIVMRLLHILLGVFWAGTLIFNALFLLPAMRDAGPDGAKVAMGLMRRRFLDIIPVVAAISILSGFWLYWRASAGQPEFMRSGTGIMFSLGAVAALLAFGLGVAIVRPSMLRATALSQSASAATPVERDAQLATAQALRLRAAGAARWVALLLAVAAGTMAVARYV
jgi:hypothetical protein